MRAPWDGPANFETISLVFRPIVLSAGARR
jgi:hypothetical protein